jgi:hypothetical protein
MVATVNASTSAGVVITPDNSGVLAFQSSSATALTISSAQIVDFANAPTVAGGAIVSAATATVLGTVIGRTTGDISPATPHKLVSLGYNTCPSVTGSSNVILGGDAASGLTSGGLNIGIGRNALQTLTTGSYNTHIGYATNAGSSSRASSIVICSGENGATDKGDNTGFIAPNTNGAVYQGNNSGTWSTTSDRRLKKNIADNTEGLNIISAVRVRNFEYRLPEEITELKSTDAVPNIGVQLGVIAQELQEVCPDCVKTESTGVMSVDSDNLFWHMVNAIKDLKSINDTLTARIVALENR